MHITKHAYQPMTVRVVLSIEVNQWGWKSSYGPNGPNARVEPPEDIRADVRREVLYQIANSAMADWGAIMDVRLS